MLKFMIIIKLTPRMAAIFFIQLMKQMLYTVKN